MLKSISKRDHRRPLALWLCLASLSASILQAQDNQNEKRGFVAESLYSVGEIDTVNLFNAGLSMVIPIGQRYPLSTKTSYGFQLVYNSKLWDYRTVLVNPPASYQRDSGGNVAFERYYGGNLQSVGTAPNLCALSLPGSPDYEIEHQYAFGSRKLSRYRSGGVPVAFKSLDLDIDESTGLASASRDASGIETALVYDTLGRLTDERPETGHGPWVKTTYVNANAMTGARARVEIEQQPNGGGASLAATRVIYDGLGRVFRELTEQPSGQFSVRETLYNARGERASVSEVELGSPANQTEFLEYDPFGRPGRVRPADGASHDVTMSYAGVRQVSRTVKVATSAGAETSSTMTEIHDRQGRLWRVIEPGTGTQTTYGYDEGSRLSSVSMAGPVTQTRLFAYDNLGFLRSETHPEIGTAGNGAVTYSRYDSRGNAGRMSDAGRTLDYTYDAAERLLTVTSAAAGLMKQFHYDTAASRGLGKVHRAIRHNYLPGVGDVVVTEAFDYAGVGGRVSSVRTTNTVNDLEFQTSQTYDALGRVRDLIYPTCLVSASCPSEPLTVRNTYTAHYLTAVGVPSDPDAGASITYHPNGLWSTLTHGNGVVTTQQNDPNSMRRPRRISVSGTVEGTPFDTGLYAYDGAGNVKSMGSDAFVYDPLSRLRESDVHGWEQDYLYDAFGNITRVETTPPGGPQDVLNLPVTAATNRLSNHGYDGAGNLTTYSGLWTQAVDPLNMPIARDSGSGTSWLALYTASEERLATLDASSGGSSVQHWTLRSPSGQVLRDFRFGLPAGGDAVFCDGFESGDTGGWESTVGVRGPPAPAVKGTCGAGSTPEWTVHTSYVYRGDTLLAEINQGDLRFYHLDHLGSVRQLTNVEADVAASYDYLPYGKEVGSSTAPRQFTGHERDSHGPGDEDNLDYMHARYYSPHLSRFIAVDPVLGDAAVPQSWNRYTYALNNPGKYIDPTGLAVVMVDQPEHAVQFQDTFTELRGELLAALADIPVVGSALSLGADLLLPAIPESSGEIIAGMVGGIGGRGGQALTRKAGDLLEGTADTVSEMAGEVAALAGKNRVSARTAGSRQVDIDLQGKSHFDKSSGQKIETPHVHEAKLNAGPNGKTNLSHRTTRPATREDVRVARKLLEHRQ